LLETAKNWADRLCTSFLKEKEANAALKTTILKMLENPLPALTLMEKQYNAIMLPVLTAALPKAKYNRNFPRALHCTDPEATRDARFTISIHPK
jgi:hypothetical protein